MEYRVMKGEIPVCETILDTSAEQPIDLDFSLPDYCPDIQKILKCQIYPTITEQTISDRLDVEGEVLVKLLYLDSGKKAVRCCEYASPFSTSIALKKAPENPSSVVTYLNTKVDYVNCRAVSPRKLDIHGAFSIQARAVSTVMQSIVSSIEEEDIQQKGSKVTLSRVSSRTQQSFTVNEVLELGQGKPEAEAIVRTDASALVEDVKVVADKLIVKGEALILSLIHILGMGEPLDNYNQVIRFLRLVSSQEGMNLGMRHISLSTCGLVDRIYDLAEENLQLTLSVSLHAPNNAIRSRTMPVNRKYPIEELLKACRYYAGRTGRRISFEYAMIDLSLIHISPGGASLSGRLLLSGGAGYSAGKAGSPRGGGKAADRLSCLLYTSRCV